MALQGRRGLEEQLDKNKLLPGETATTLDTKKIFHAFGPGDVDQMATVQEMRTAINEVTEEVKDQFTAGVTQSIADAQTATQAADIATEHATTQGNYAKTQGDYAKTQGEAAASIVNDSIASETIPGNVRGGGDVKVDTLTGDMTVPSKLDKTGDASEATVEISETEEDGEIATGPLSTIFGLVKKKFSLMLLALAGKIDKTSIVQSAEISDATKVPSTTVTAWLASQISSLSSSLSQLNNNLATQSQELTLLNDWTTYNGLKIYKTGNVCYITGILYAGSVGTNVGIASLPQGFRPTSNRHCAVCEINTSSYTVSKICQINVGASGTISLLGGFTAGNRYDVGITYVI